MKKILLVEDEKNIRLGITEFFDWEKADSKLLDTAKNGEEGLRKIYIHKPDIVITDVRMPFLNGLDMIEEAMKFHRFDSIVISGYEEFNYAKKALQLNVKEYILKSIDFSELLNAINNLNIKNSEINKYGAAQEFVDYIKNNMDKRIYLQDLSDHFFLSDTTINNIIKEEFNLTSNELINVIKIDYSVSLLKMHKYKLYEIAEMAGFSSYKHFYKVFKKIKGINPSEYIKQIKTF